MDGAYFVGRTQLLNWLNEFFRLGYEKVEQVCTGAAHCLIMDALHPGKVPLHKVNFNAKFDYEYIKNYKILQEVFADLGIQKTIEVNKLIKGKYQDNLEFLQWMKKYFDNNWNGREYDAEARIRECTNYAKEKNRVKKVTTPVVNRKAAQKGVSSKDAWKVTPSVARMNSKEKVDQQVVNRLKKEIAELNLQVDNLEKERNFYFEKLRDIEILCDETDPEKVPLVKQIQAILYATEDDFVIDEDDDEAPSSSPEH